MRDLLQSDYAINVKERTNLYGKTAYLDEHCIYFLIPTERRETTMEQAALSYYLYENNYIHTACPIQTVGGSWFTNDRETQYYLVKVEDIQGQTTLPAGSQLAAFHQIGAAYKFEPPNISSYGQWKQLWTQKLTTYESYLYRAAKERSHHFYQLAIDSLPYIIGISENAIAYIGASNHDTRYTEADQGTITFNRYHGQLIAPILWSNDLTYDHPGRDVAEYIRHAYLLNPNGDAQDIVTFIDDYQQVNPLSLFSWQQIYARLIYPVHFFDVLERGFLERNDEENVAKLKDLITQQPKYEQKLNTFYDLSRINYSQYDIPVLNWL